MAEKNIGGYDENYKYDRKAVNYVEGFLLESKLIMPHLASGDKAPNLDGYLEICEHAERKKNPIGRFDVQVKSLNGEYVNDNVRYNVEHAYKYSCDTKVINVVLGALTYNPVLLLLVDNRENRIFWKYMSLQYCLELDAGVQNNKTIYFDDEDEILNSDDWYDCLCQIHKKHAWVHKNGKESLFLLAKEVQVIPPMLQQVSDTLNHMLDNELWFIKQVFFPDTWKLGIAYLEGGVNDFSCMGLYKIKLGKNDLFIKQFKEESEYFWSVHYGGGYCLEDIVRQTLAHWIEEFFNRDNYYLFLFPDVVLQELFFEVLDMTMAESEMGDRNKTQVVLGWPDESFFMEEMDKLPDVIWENRIFDGVVQELKRRKINPVYRPWEKGVNYHISKADEHCIEYKEDFDLAMVERKNKWLFLKGFQDFFARNKEYFGERSDKVFAWKNSYMVVAADDMDCYVYGVESSERFTMDVYLKSEHPDLYHELKAAMSSDCGKYSGVGSGLMFCNDYSWYKLWRILNRNLFLRYIGAKESLNIGAEYIAAW